jgi:hypothetical protein
MQEARGMSEDRLQKTWIQKQEAGSRQPGKSGRSHADSRPEVTGKTLG